MRNPFLTFLNKHGVNFRVVRNNVPVATYKGLIENKYIGFEINCDIQAGDQLIDPSGINCYVDYVDTVYHQGAPIALNAYKLSEKEYKEIGSQSNQQNIFNVMNATHSVIGTQESVTINFNQSFEDIEKLINNKNSEDKQELIELITTLKELCEKNMPINKGMFAKFSQAMERNSWISGPLAGILLSYMLGC